jgi:hypothetical protein
MPLTLVFIIHRDNIQPQSIRLLKIHDTATVVDFRALLQEQLPIAFQDVLAYSLYKVSIPLGNAREHIQRLISYDFPQEDLMNSSDLLSQCFPDGPTEGHIHVIVKPIFFSVSI